MPQLLSGDGAGVAGTAGGLAGAGLVGMSDLPHYVKTIVEHLVASNLPSVPPEVLLAYQGLAVFFANFLTFAVSVAMAWAVAWITANLGYRIKNGGASKPLADGGET